MSHCKVAYLKKSTPLQKIQKILPQISVTQSIELCPICGMSCNTQNELKNHIAIKHEPNNEPKMNQSEPEMAKSEPTFKICRILINLQI